MPLPNSSTRLRLRSDGVGTTLRSTSSRKSASNATNMDTLLATAVLTKVSCAVIAGRKTTLKEKKKMYQHQILQELWQRQQAEQEE